MKAIITSIAFFVSMCACAVAQEGGPSEGKKVSVKIRGSIMKPGTYRLVENATITDVIYAAGGPNFDGPSGGADLGSVRVLRKGTVTKISVKKIYTHKAENFVLQDNDIIQVPEAIF